MTTQYIEKRFFAFVIDLCVISLLPGVYYGLLVAMPEVASILGRPEPANLIFVICCAYYIFMEASYLQATAGKRIMGLIVRRTDGESVSFLRACTRMLVRYLSIFTFGTGYLAALIAPRSQTLHDLSSRTVVLELARHGVRHCACCALRHPKSAAAEVLDLEAAGTMRS